MICNQNLRVGCRWLICVLVMASSGWAQQTSTVLTNLPYAGATITDFTGMVKLEMPAQAPMPPTRGLSLPAGTSVSTDEGKVLLHLQDGSAVTVRAHTRILLTEPGPTDWRYIQLVIGRIRTEVQKRLGGAPGFQIGTPSAVISVRGTRFLVEVNRHNVTEVDVEQGLVEVKSVNGLGEPVLVGAGFSTRVGENSAPEAPRPTREYRPELERPGHDSDRDNGRESGIEAGSKGGEHEQPLQFDEPGEAKPGSEPSLPAQESEPSPQVPE